MCVSVKSIGVSSVAVAPRGNVPTVIRLTSVLKSLPHNQLPLALAPRGLCHMLYAYHLFQNLFIIINCQLHPLVNLLIWRVRFVRN